MAELRRTYRWERTQRANPFGPTVVDTEEDDYTIEGTGEEIVQILAEVEKQDKERSN